VYAHWKIPEEFVLSGTYQCMVRYAGNAIFMTSITWILATVWEVLALCLAVWIAVKHFRELRRHSTRGIIRDTFTILMQTHVSYFARWAHNVNVVLLFRWHSVRASFLVISCFKIFLFSPTRSAVCRSLTDLYVRPWSIISIGQVFTGYSDLSRS